MEVAGVRVASGAVLRHARPITELPDGLRVSLPLLLMNGASPGPRLYLGAAIYGDEAAAVEILSTALAKVRPLDLSSSIVCVPVQNPLASRRSPDPCRSLLEVSPPPGADRPVVDLSRPGRRQLRPEARPQPLRPHHTLRLRDRLPHSDAAKTLLVKDQRAPLAFLTLHPIGVYDPPAQAKPVALDPDAFRPERQRRTEPFSPSGAAIPDDVAEVEIPEFSPCR